MWHFILLKNYYVRRELKKQARLDCRWVFSATLLLHLLPWLGTSVRSRFLNGILWPLWWENVSSCRNIPVRFTNLSGQVTPRPPSLCFLLGSLSGNCPSQRSATPPSPWNESILSFFFCTFPRRRPIPGTRPDSGLAPWQGQRRCAPGWLGWRCRSVCAVTVQAEAGPSCWRNRCSWTRPAVMTLCWLALPGSYAGLGPDGCRWHRWLVRWRCPSGGKRTGASHRSGRTTPCFCALWGCCSSSGCCRYWKRSVCCSPRRISPCEMLWQKKNIWVEDHPLWKWTKVKVLSEFTQCPPYPSAQDSFFSYSG